MVMRLSKRGQERHIRQTTAATDLLSRMDGVEVVIQVGLGDWGEGPSFLKLLPSADYYGIEPLVKYCKEAAERGFPGRIGQYAAWSESMLQLILPDRKMKSSFFCRETEPLQIPVNTVTLDFLQKVWKIPKKPTLLWLDCEGSELEVLLGAGVLLKDQVEYIVCEHRENPPFPGWPTSDDIFAYLGRRGFFHIYQHRQDGLFVKQVGP